MQSAHQRFKRRGNLLIFFVLTVAAILGYIVFVLASHAGPGMLVQTNGNEIGGTFRLDSLGESTVTEGDFHGTWMLVWFFDPRCPKARCQTVIKALEAARDTLHADGIPTSVLAVSLDAKAPDSDALHDYVIPVAPHVMPFTGTENMIAAMTAEYHAPLHLTDGYFAPAPRVVVMNPDSRYAGTIDVTGDTAHDTAAIEAQLRKFAGH